jgi:Flp pilus assembly protein TadG
MTTVRRPRLQRTAPSKDERGVALVWMALFMFILLVFAGFAVDLTNWYLNAERVQRAADAGAHAGVVFLPADLTNATAKARAETVARVKTRPGRSRKVELGMFKLGSRRRKDPVWPVSVMVR